MSDLLFTDPRLQEEIKNNTRTKLISKDTTFLLPGDHIVFIPIVLKGVLRIVREDEEGREVFLYHLYPSETCAMAINCCQAGKKSMVKAIAEDDTELLLVPVKMIEDWFKYPEWRMFINNTYSTRFEELIRVIDLVSFSNLDQQILHYLEKRCTAAGSSTLTITHQQIADELHTHREAVSRLLRTMEEKKMVRLGRNSIELLN
ncbi:Crp/Fnr family transcriptional regulator [Arcticibacter tournemirensis]|uniref:Crp/Fnr family transcriptional regulator n=1 Tax=Arcticibacter tournemirensis TaxID=699437 RepID=A0A4Q0MCG5_9SPHI|nr:Crp/Fnr family transcriptional regulator [Arcticibacter tournemirensis]RXF70589.1 Crp/Fnr family transcriptional regulator [Arcticibacter tournemirensis]